MYLQHMFDCSSSFRIRTLSFFFLCLHFYTQHTHNTHTQRTQVTKVGNNLRWWCNNVDIVHRTMDVFHWVVCGYGSGKFLLELDTVRYVLLRMMLYMNPSCIGHRAVRQIDDML